MDERQDKLFGDVIKTAILWVLLQIICGWRNFWVIILEQSFDIWHWVGTGLYILALLALDISIYRFRSANVAKSWAKYWGFCMAVLFLARFSGTDVFETTMAVLLILAAPYYAISPIWSFIRGQGHAVVILAFCAVHLIYLLILARQVKKPVQ